MLGGVLALFIHIGSLLLGLGVGVLSAKDGVSIVFAGIFGVTLCVLVIVFGAISRAGSRGAALAVIIPSLAGLSLGLLSGIFMFIAFLGGVIGIFKRSGRNSGMRLAGWGLVNVALTLFVVFGLHAMRVAGHG
jgi:hypothetical protein